MFIFVALKTFFGFHLVGNIIQKKVQRLTFFKLSASSFAICNLF